MAKFVKTGDVAVEVIHTWLRDKKKAQDGFNYLVIANKDSIDNDTTGEWFFRLMSFAIDGGADPTIAMYCLFHRFPEGTRAKINQLALAINQNWLESQGHELGPDIVDRNELGFDEEIYEKASKLIDERKPRLKK